MGVGALFSAAVTFLGSGTTAAAIAAVSLRIAGAVVVSALVAKKPGKPGIAARTVTTRGTLDAQQLIYGEALVGGSLAYRNVHGNHNSELWSVHCLAGHECESILDVYLGDTQIANSIINGGAAGGGGVDSGTFGPTRSTVNTVEVWKHLGTSSQTVDTNLQTAAGSGVWSSNHRLRGIAYGVTMFKLNDKTESVWERHDPENVKFLVRGKKVYDPRLDSTRVIDSSTSPLTYGSGSHRVDDGTTWEWSDNPALCAADVLMDAKFSAFPGGIDADRIDWEAVADAADACDTLVFVPPAASPQNTQKRFTCNGVLYGTATPQDNLTAILSSMNGELVFTGGLFVIMAGVYASPVDSLDEDDLAGPVAISSALDSEKRVNTLKATYIDSSELYEPTETLPITISAYKDTRDGGHELTDTIELPMTDNWYMAQRLVLKSLYQANEEHQIRAPYNLRAARVVPGERVNQTITERGWTPKIFRARDWELFDRGGDDWGVNLTLREDQSGAYADPDVSDYNVYSASGTLTVAEPEPVPSVDSIPRGVNWGGGTWTIEAAANLDEDDVATDGWVRFSRGRFILPDGTIRSLADPGHIDTSYEGSNVPPDGRFYMVSGATNPVTRFAQSPTPNFGEGDAEGAGMFTAIHDRFNDSWYAVDLAGLEIEFTPLSTDYIVATGTKTSASGGIDTFTPLVQYVEPTQPENLLPSRFSDFEEFPGGWDGILRTPTTRWFITAAGSYLGDVYASCELGSDVTGRFPLTYGTNRNILIRPNRRWLVTMAMYPESHGVNADVDYYIDMVFSSGQASSTVVTGDELTVNEWQIVQFEIDGTGNASESAYIEIVQERATSTDVRCRYDAIQLMDITDKPEYRL